MQKGNPILSDKASGLVSAIMAVGAIFSPILGGVLNDKFGYRTTCDVEALILFVAALLYFCTVIVPHVL